MLAILLCCVLLEEEFRSPEEAGVNRVYVRKTSLATPKGNGIRCKTTSPFVCVLPYECN